MSIDAFILRNDTDEGLRRTADLTLPDDAVELPLWALQADLRELERETSERLGLYGDSRFDGQKLSVFRRWIAATTASIAEGPAVLTVNCGEELVPRRQVVVREVSRESVLQFLKALEDLASRAESENRVLFFAGD